jgi:small subunit ribosomal protein S7
VAENVVYGSFDVIKDKTKQDPRHIFNKALKKVSPLAGGQRPRIGGANYQIPYQVRGERRFSWVAAGYSTLPEKERASR